MDTLHQVHELDLLTGRAARLQALPVRFPVPGNVIPEVLRTAPFPSFGGLAACPAPPGRGVNPPKHLVADEIGLIHSSTDHVSRSWFDWLPYDSSSLSNASRNDSQGHSDYGSCTNDTNYD